MKVSEKKIYKVLDGLGISKDCGDVKRVMDVLFPKEEGGNKIIPPDEFNVKIDKGGVNYFDVILYHGNVKIAMIGPGGHCPADQGTASGYTIETEQPDNFGGYFRIRK